MKDPTESEVQESWHTMVLCILKVPLQGFPSLPAESVLALYCNVEVNPDIAEKPLKSGEVSWADFREAALRRESSQSLRAETTDSEETQGSE